MGFNSVFKGLIWDVLRANVTGVCPLSCNLHLVTCTYSSAFFFSWNKRLLSIFPSNAMREFINYEVIFLASTRSLGWVRDLTLIMFGLSANLSFSICKSRQRPISSSLLVTHILSALFSNTLTLRSAFSWYFTHSRMIVSCRRFGITRRVPSSRVNHLLSPSRSDR